MRFTDFVEIQDSKIDNVNNVFEIAKRHNNPKRTFLLTNKLLGKHVAAKGKDILEHFDELYNEVATELKGRKVLVVGFAETATALSNHIFHKATETSDFEPVYYIQTTREVFPKKLKYISFEEEHSHATTQRLYLDSAKLPKYDTVLFVEDEITTGQTIRNFIEKFKEFNTDAEYAVASILNLQSKENHFKDIKTIYLVKGLLKENTISVNETHPILKEAHPPVERNTFPIGPNPRKGLTREEYLKWWKSVELAGDEQPNALVLGTEELMYPAIKLASRLGAYTKSTTRSPIVISNDEGYLFRDRHQVTSTYDNTRVVNFYTSDKEAEYDMKLVLIEDHTYPHTLEEYTDLGFTPLLIGNKLIQSSLSWLNCTMLLQDLNGRVEILDTAEREKRNQEGTHYSEMVALEKEPSAEYSKLYDEALEKFGPMVVKDTIKLAKNILELTPSPVIVSLARAGTPIGILLSEIYDSLYDIQVPHYSISILRGKGIDIHALKSIIEMHDAKDVVFVDGWTGKGTIARELSESIRYFESKMIESTGRIAGVNPGIAVVADPAGVALVSGTQEDYLMPNSLLNSTVSGLTSRTVKLKDMTDEELHGAIAYNNLEHVDKSLESLERLLPEIFEVDLDILEKTENKAHFEGYEEVLRIAAEYGIEDINKIKPGIGETTRVLLRRVPDVVLISETAPENYVEHIKLLCKEKNVEYKTVPLKIYNTIGIIKSVADL